MNTERKYTSLDVREQLEIKTPYGVVIIAPTEHSHNGGIKECIDVSMIFNSFSVYPLSSNHVLLKKY